MKPSISARIRMKPKKTALPTIPFGKSLIVQLSTAVALLAAVAASHKSGASDSEPAGFDASPAPFSGDDVVFAGFLLPFPRRSLLSGSNGRAFSDTLGAGVG